MSTLESSTALSVIANAECTQERLFLRPKHCPRRQNLVEGQVFSDFP